jgi:outer membrane protein assembly factor BamB
MKMRCLLVMGVSLGVFSLAASAADWPQWRGPQRNGISQETGLLKQWPKEGPQLLWQVKNIDFGYSTPAVVGDRIYLLSNKGMDDEFAQALEVKDGSQVWATHLGKVGPNKQMNYPGARSTPTVDGELLYVIGSDGDMSCLETATGKLRWQKNLRTEFGGKCGLWAYSESPLVDGDVVVCTPGGSKATLVALNKKTGDVIWQCPVPGGDEAAYASAIVYQLGDSKQYVQFLQKGLVGVDAKTGKFLWRYAQTAKNSMANIPTPVAYADTIYSSSGQGGSGLVKLKATQEAVDAEEVYFAKKLPNAIGGSILLGEYLYGTGGQGLMCMEFATGKVKWQDRCVGPASICFADGCLVLHGERKNEVALVEATPDGYKEKGRFTPPDPAGKKERGVAQSWSYPVISNGRLYIRDVNVLWCYDIKDTK